MANTAKSTKEATYAWEGKDIKGRMVKGEMQAYSENFVKATLRRQGISVKKIKKQRTFTIKRGKVSEKDITLFTRQLATMLKSGIPLLQSFDIVGKGHSKPIVSKLLANVKADIETGSSLNAAFRKHPLHFDALYCNMIKAGEEAGILDAILERLASYREKVLGIKSKIKSALFYPIAIVVVAFIVTTIMMIYVIPTFKQLFTSFGADLPLPTVIVMKISDFFVAWWWIIFSAIGLGLWFFFYTWKRSTAMQATMDRLLLRLPIFGELIRKATIARFARTLSTIFAAGVPLVEALDSVAGAAGNRVYYDATKAIQSELITGTSLTVAMQNSKIFPSMVLQMTEIGEESGELDAMLSKVADFYEEEVDDAMKSLSSLMEPIIMVVLGTLIGGLVIAMYLPIFKIASVVG